MKDIYQTIAAPTIGDFRDRGSKFLAYAYEINTNEDIKKCLTLVKKEHPKARHHCFAYRLGTDKNNFRANDDGEPSGSAGRPILGQIDSFGLTNVIVIVVRYFGGTKLGIPGLINAYKTSTADAFNQATIVKRIIKSTYQLHFDYATMSSVMGFLKRNKMEIISQDFGEKAILNISMKMGDAEQLVAALNEHINPYGQENFDLGIQQIQ